MIKKRVVQLVLCLNIIFLALLGCGDDEEVTKKPTEPEPVEINEDILGSWNVTSINDGSPLLFLVEDEPDEADRPKITINEFIFEFSDDGTWKSNLEAVMSEFPEAPANEEGKIEIVGMWSGTFITKDTHLTLTITEKDVNFTSDPEEFFEMVFEIQELTARQELIDEFNANLLIPFQKTFVTVKENSLILKPAGSEKQMVLEK